MKEIKSHWTKKQTERLAYLLDEGKSWIGYWCSDQFGRPSNGGMSRKPVRPGMMQKIDPAHVRICEYGFHATLHPHRWVGCRVWIVALHGSMPWDKGSDKITIRDDKACAATREILGEVYPEESFLNAQVSIKFNSYKSIGYYSYKDLSHTDLKKAMCANSTYRYIDFSYADLYDADFSRSDVSYSNFLHSNLKSASFAKADLYGANLQYANLNDAYMAYADLYYADMRHVTVHGANFNRAKLDNAQLGCVNFIGAYIENATFKNAHVKGATISHCQKQWFSEPQLAQMVIK